MADTHEVILRSPPAKQDTQTHTVQLTTVTPPASDAVYVVWIQDESYPSNN